MSAVPDSAAGGRADLDLITEVAQEAGEIANAFFGNSAETWYKGKERSPVSEADYAANRHLGERLRAARPGYGWLSEESLDDPGRLHCETIFVVDPIDGTRGFLAGKRDWCISVGIVHRGEAVAGVLAAPARREVWTARRGHGAFLNGRPLPERAPREVKVPLLVSMADRFVQAVGQVEWAEIVRAPGGPSLALRLARVASGELGAVLVRPQSNEWDLAAADVLLRETGHVLVEATGKRVSYNEADPARGTLIAAAPGEITLLQGCLPESSGH